MYKRKHSRRKRYIDGFADSIARHSRSFKKGRSPKYHREVINLSLYRGRMLTKKRNKKSLVTLGSLIGIIVLVL